MPRVPFHNRRERPAEFRSVRRIGLLLALALLLIPAGVTLQASYEEDLALVLKVLKTPPRDPNHHDGKYWDNAKELRDLGDTALPLLATHLRGHDAIGSEALFTMLEMGADKSAPYIFGALPGSVQEGVQKWAFKRFNDRLLRGEEIPAKKEIRAAAVRCLDADNKEVAPLETIHALGLTGSDEDWPLLEEVRQRYLAHAEKAPNLIVANHWQNIANAAEAALGRLGHPASLDNIEAKLKQSVRLPAESEALVSWIEEAAFTGNQRFVPLLCKHLDDKPTPPSVSPMCVVVYASPNVSAAEALRRIVKRTSSDLGMTEAEFEEWKKWAAKHQQ